MRVSFSRDRGAYWAARRRQQQARLAGRRPFPRRAYDFIHALRIGKIQGWAHAEPLEGKARIRYDATLRVIARYEGPVKAGDRIGLDHRWYRVAAVLLMTKRRPLHLLCREDLPNRAKTRRLRS